MWFSDHVWELGKEAKVGDQTQTKSISQSSDTNELIVNEE